jgi:hypothetical protein
MPIQRQSLRMTMVQAILRGFGRLVAFAGLLAWALGSLWSYASANPDMFHRFGALGVAASVLFFTERLLKIELSRQRSVERLLHEYGVELAALKSGKPPTEIPQKGYVVDFLTEERNFDLLRRKADFVNIANVTLMTVATLQWGFGDRFLIWLNEARV